MNFVEMMRDDVVDTTTLEMLEVRLTKLDETWAQFTALHDETLKATEAKEMEELEVEFGEYENRYFFIHSSLRKSIRERQSAQRDDSVCNQLGEQQSRLLEKIDVTSEKTPVQLPKLTVPHFSGNYKDWPSFRDTFMGAVGNNQNLSATQKFHYLTSYLRDDAATLIKHLSVTEGNYVEAWQRLEKRYDRVNLIVQAFIQTFLSLPSASMSNVHMLRKLTDGSDEAIRGLNALGSNSRDPWLIYLLANKLDVDTKQAWAETVGSRKNVQFEELLNFLHSRCDALECCQSLARVGASRDKPKAQFRSHFAESHSNAVTQSHCPKCNGKHILPQCEQFLLLNVDMRRAFVKSKQLCFNCLRPGHPAGKCRSSFRCRVCHSRHHSLVHADTNNASSSHHTETAQNIEATLSCLQLSANPQPVSNHSSLIVGLPRHTILPTILAQVQDIQGNSISCRVLLDSGSQLSFIVESFAQRLGLPRKQARVSVLGVSSTKAGQTRGRVCVNLGSRLNKTNLMVKAFVLTKLTSNIPSQSFETSGWSHLQNLELADPNFNVPGPIDMLLGADKLWCILRGNQVQGSDGLPIAQNTSFGWVVTGEVLDAEPSHHQTVSSFHSVLDVDVLLQRFWELEEVTPFNRASFADDAAEQHFQKTFSRSSDGCYVVQLPFKTPSPVFGPSLNGAIRRLHSMERRFKSDPALYETYVKFMQEYRDLGHMVRIPSDVLETTTTTGEHFYLPHHAVLKLDSSTTKLRVVFDGSASDSEGNSLNSQLRIGPPIQRDLVGVCLRFRQHKYVFTADVVKMFRQIWVDNRHVDFQRIVWRESPSDEIDHFRLLTVTYGTASAPFLSVRVLMQLAIDYQTQYPNASRVLLENVYVDDIMTGADSAEELIKLQAELVSLLSNAKLELRKWNSNCWALLARLPKEDCEFSWFDMEGSNSIVKILGMHWNPTSDHYSFRMNGVRGCATPTRRSLLSEISRIFDPFGLLAPSVVLFKMLFQELWSSDLKLSWDDPLPLQLAKKWSRYQHELHFFEKVQVPRNIYSSSEDIELHGFSDASLLAYSAVVYARCKLGPNKFKIVIVAAKTKVAPIKPMSIPRLELCGALLLSRLVTLIRSSVSRNLPVFAWCDSQIVLHWLSSSPRRWSTFVANRTAAILEKIPRYSWQHIASEFNPADCASRGILPSALIKHSLWWTGPAWLSLPHHHWPSSTIPAEQVDNPEIAVEERHTQTQIHFTSAEIDVFDHLIEKISSWTRLLRIVAYCVRFPNNCRPKGYPRCTGGLTVSELQLAEHHILKLVQQHSFENEIRQLNRNRDIKPKSKLLRYSPFIDKDGLLRVGGRIKLAYVSFTIKHPIILPKDYISSLLVKHIHSKYLHPGVSETFAIVRQRYWILGSRNLVRAVVHRCRACFLQRKVTRNQLMGDLPPERVRQSRPFINAGCDYAGPFTIRLSRGRTPKTSKAYLALFVCMCTKAVHLELVSDLTTDAFLAALRRFVSRRGKCSNIYTDNGTNFQGARRILNDMQKVVLSQTYNEDIKSSLAMDGITWHFIPPSAPHFGGLWEAGVKSAKLHLRRVVGTSVLTFEELYTVFTEIEAVLNSRPLCAISDTDLNPLTPSHFLIGEPHTAVPEPNLLEVPFNRLAHWKHLQSMVQGFWKRWQMEYITSLQERPKWKSKQVDIQVGDLVVVKEPHLPPTKWLLGKIETVHPGPDKRTRVATIRTTRGNFVRPITKLAVLPLF